MKFCFQPKNVDMLCTAVGKTPEEALVKLNGYLEVNSVVTAPGDLYLLSMRESVYLDFLFGSFVFGKKAEYSNGHTASILNVALTLIDNVKQGMNQEENLAVLKDLTKGLLASDGEQKHAVFSLQQCQDVFESFVKTLFKNYGLFHYVFTKEQEDRITSEERTVEHLPILPPLQQATPEQTWLDEKQREEDAIREAEEHRVRQAAEAERRRIEDAESAERLKEVSAKDAFESLSHDTIQSVAEKVIADHLGPLCNELRNRILLEQKMIIKEAGLQVDSSA